MQKRKVKKKNTAKRKDPVVAECVRRITQDAILTVAEMEAAFKEANPAEEGETQKEIEKDEKGRMIVDFSDLPDGITHVDTLQGHFLYHDERLKRHIETMTIIIHEFHDAFWEENGQSILELKYDRKRRTWADDQTLLHFCYTAIAMGLARWTFQRREWAALPNGLPYIQFICTKRNGETNDTSTISSPFQGEPSEQAASI